MQCIVTYATVVYSWLSKISSEKCLILDTFHPHTLYLRQQGREDPWLFFEDKRGPRAKTFEEHCYRKLLYFVQYITPKEYLGKVLRASIS